MEALSSEARIVFNAIQSDLANKIADSVEKQFENQTQVTVYEIQDAVEKKLMGSSRKEVAQSYITYRYNRDVARKSKTREMFIEFRFCFNSDKNILIKSISSSVLIFSSFVLIPVK